MILKKYKYILIIVTALLFAFTSCMKDLDTLPLDKDVVTSASVYENADSYYQVLAKLYAGLAVSGQEGPAGNNDLSGLDEGFGQYLRAYWYAQELPTDEAIISWNDGNLRDYWEMDWGSNNEFISNMYYRVFYQVSLCNEFIRETTEAKMNDRGIDAAKQTEINGFRAEARFLRALSYYHALDMFANVPFVTEEDAVGSFFPEQTNRAELYAYIESELLAIEEELQAPRANEYGRADKAALWMLLGKLYQNAEVYIGEPKNTECLTYVNKVIGAGYTLENNYSHLFMADNHLSGEVIFPITFDGVNTKTWGGTTFIIDAAIGGTMNPADFGTQESWSGLRVMKSFVGKFYNLETLKSARIPLKSAAEYPLLYVPGNYQAASGYGADWAPDDEAVAKLASVNSDETYEGYVWFANNNVEFKLNKIPGWEEATTNGDVDELGNTGNLLIGSWDSKNIKVAESGFYRLTADFNDAKYTVTKTDWGLIGDATPGGWDTDTNMEYDADEKAWTMIVELGSGEIKFRANDGWDINLGDNDADGILEYGGSNIIISDPGKYEIKLYIGTPDYTYSVEKFSSDERALFHSDGQTLDITDPFEFTEGWAVTKWKNVTSDGIPGSDVTHSDTDFPMFRLADAYLMYAEAVLRGGSGGDIGTALGYINQLRTRAYTDTGGNITQGELTLDFIIDERGRELFWEGHRRTDLIRFGKFSGDEYIWQWKGAVQEGKAIDAKYNIYPIPASDVVANINLKQNPGY